MNTAKPKKRKKTQKRKKLVCRSRGRVQEDSPILLNIRSNNSLFSIHSIFQVYIYNQQNTFSDVLNARKPFVSNFFGGSSPKKVQKRWGLHCQRWDYAEVHHEVTDAPFSELFITRKMKLPSSKKDNPNVSLEIVDRTNCHRRTALKNDYLEKKKHILEKTLLSKTTKRLHQRLLKNLFFPENLFNNALFVELPFRWIQSLPWLYRWLKSRSGNKSLIS